MRKQTLVLWSIVILSGALALAMLTKGHDWGDDFAAYIMQAAGIVHGTVREPVAHMAFTMRESSRAYGPIAAPWGFPTLLAPFYLACGGLNIFCLKLINVPFFAFFLIAWFALLTRRLSLVDSAIALSILAFSPALLSFQDNVLSDITFLFFSTLSVLLIDAVMVASEKPEGSLAASLPARKSARCQARIVHGSSSKYCAPESCKGLRSPSRSRNASGRYPRIFA